MDPICILQTLNEASKATPNKFSVSLSMRAGGPYISIMKLAAFQVIICLGTAITNNVITFSACTFIVYIARITQT